MENAKVNLAPPVTSASMDAWNEEQKIWAAKVPVPAFLLDLNLIHDVRRRQIGADLTHALKATAAARDRAPSIVHKKRALEAFNLASERYAAFVADEGDFKLAEETATDPQKKALYGEYRQALAAGSEPAEICEHWNGQFADSKKTQNVYIERYFNIGQSRIPLLRCNVCRFAVIRPTNEAENKFLR